MTTEHRIQAVERLGFTSRQAAFLTMLPAIRTHAAAPAAADDGQRFELTPLDAGLPESLADGSGEGPGNDGPE